MDSTGVTDHTQVLTDRIDELEQRVARLEELAAAGSPRPARATRPCGHVERSGRAWTRAYAASTPDKGDVWIEMHEPSARPQLQRMIIDVVAAEGPVTDGLLLRRVREAWGVRRAGTRIQQVFDQNLRQLVSTLRLVRPDPGCVALPDQDVIEVRIPDPADDGSRRAADEVPGVELQEALRREVADVGSCKRDALTSDIARLFGWTRRGTEIQSALNAALDALIASGVLEHHDGLISQGAVVGPDGDSTAHA